MQGSICFILGFQGLFSECRVKVIACEFKFGGSSVEVFEFGGGQGVTFQSAGFRV